MIWVLTRLNAIWNRPAGSLLLKSAVAGWSTGSLRDTAMFTGVELVPLLFYGRKVELMDIVSLSLCIVFMAIGLQFLRGKWLNLLNWLQQFAGGAGSDAQLHRAGMVLSPGLIALGFSMFCWGFFGPGAWRTAGNAIFFLSLLYLLAALVGVYLTFVRDNNTSA